MRTRVGFAVLLCLLVGAVGAEGAPAGGDLTIVMRWGTQGTDMDLHVVEPSGERCCTTSRRTRSGGQLLNDCLQGPGSETYVHPNPPPGDYRIEVVNYEGGPLTQVTVEVLRGGQRVGTYRATLSRRLERAHVHTLRLGGQPIGPGPISTHSRQDTAYTRLTAQQIRDALRASGVVAREGKTAKGAPRWSFELDTWKVVLFANDDNRRGDGTYNSLELMASFAPPPVARDVLLERVNDWNRGMRDARAFINNRGSCVLAGDCDITGGVSVNVVRELLDIFRRSLGPFVDRVVR